MAETAKALRQSVTLPSKVARQVRTLAKRRRVSANRMLVELIEEGLALQQRKEAEFFELAERFRAAKSPDEIDKLGNELGKMVFGG